MSNSHNCPAVHASSAGVIGSELWLLDGRRAGVVPVDQRIVHAELQPPTRAGVGQQLNRILPKRRGVHGVEARELRVPQAESVVVLGGNHDITHPGPLRHAGDGVGVELFRGELVGQFHIFVAWDIGPVHDLLVGAGDVALPHAAERE